MIKSHTRALASCMFLGILASCTLEPLPDNIRVEEYTRNFIKTFGLIDPNQDWNMAEQAVIPISLGSGVQKSVKVYIKQGDTYYLVADLSDVSGKLQVPVDIPKDCEDVMVKVNGHKFYGKVGHTVNCRDMSRGVPNGSAYPEDTNNSAVIYEASKGDYKVKVQYTTSGNDPNNPQYQIFNTQQISPIISPEKWNEYYSLNTNSWSGPNREDAIGLLPESGEYNRTAYDIQSWLNEKKAENHELVVDFKVNPGDNGMFTFFPYYYGTNLEHEIGVYLIDDTGEPRTTNNLAPAADGSNWVTFPIFRDREPGDLQVQPHYDTKITDIRIKDCEQGNNRENYFEVEVGADPFYLDPYVEVKYDGEWIPYATYLRDYGQETHSRVALHLWGDPPVEYAKCSKDGHVTGLTRTRGEKAACLAISTGYRQTGNKVMTVGVKNDNVRYKVIDPNFVKTTRIKTITVDEIESGELKLTTGTTTTLHVHCYDSEGAELLPFSTVYDELSVTSWQNGKCRLYKDDNDKTIKIEVYNDFDNYEKIWVDLNEDGNVDDSSEPQCVLHIVATSGSTPSTPSTGTVSHTTDETFNTWPTDAARTWDSFFEEKTETPATEKLKVTITQDLVPQAIKDIFVDAIYHEDGNWYSYNWSYSKTVTEEGNEVTKYFYEELVNYFRGDDGAAHFRAWATEHPINGLTVTEATNYLAIYGTYSYNDSPVDLRTHNISNFSENNLQFAIVFENQSPSSSPVTYWDWKDNAKTQAQDILNTYYSGKTKTMNCTTCGTSEEYSFESVTLNTNATKDDNGVSGKTVYTVTWKHTKEVQSQNKPGYRKTAVKQQSSRLPRLSRDGGKPALLEEIPGGWIDINTVWTRYLPYKEEVACYPPNMTMLARSRGHDITLTNKDGTPYTGEFGMYMKVLGSNNDDDDNMVIDYDEYANPYTVYSERKYNTDEAGRPYPQISAVSFKHPVTGRPFLSFEDMRVTHPGPDEPTMTGSSAYDSMEKSSDRDINDLVFFVSGFESISDKDGNKITTEKIEDAGFPWLWAVEDLGSTNDFDFNDVVVKISSITTTDKKTTVKGEGDDKTTTVEYNVLHKRVSFTPVAAGGTLPVYIHLVVDKTDYVLRPGTYNVTGNDEFTLAGVTFDSNSRLTSGEGSDAEVHSWFGADGYPSTTMINTGYGVRASAKSCILYVPAPTCNKGTGALNNDGFSLNIFSTGHNTLDNKHAQTAPIHFYLAVTGLSGVTTGYQGEINDERLNIDNRALGDAPQSFIVKGSEWKWPKERAHILEAYPKFADWVTHPENTTWMKEQVNKAKIYTE